MKRLAILVNVVSPYRLPIYSFLGTKYKTHVLHGGNEKNRSWKVEESPTIHVQKVFTLQIPTKKRNGVDGISDTIYVHLNLGLVWSLIRFRPEIILSNEMGLRTVIATLYGMLARVPVWVWWGGTLHSERYISGMRRILRRFIVRRVKHWISYGESSTEYLESLGVARPQVLQIQNCVPHETFLVVPSHPTKWFENHSRPVILSVGQLVPRKGFDKLIEACGRLAERGFQFSLTIVGEGPEQGRLLEMANAAGIEQFQILSHKSQAALNELYRAADVFVFPTLEDIWGLVVNEAMWAGTPVLCSKYAGCAEELLPQQNIFDPLEPESFDAALRRVFDGSMAPPDRSRLKPWQEVSEMIALSLAENEPVPSFCEAVRL